MALTKNLSSLMFHFAAISVKITKRCAKGAFRNYQDCSDYDYLHIKEFCKERPFFRRIIKILEQKGRFAHHYIVLTGLVDIKK